LFSIPVLDFIFTKKSKSTFEKEIDLLNRKRGLFWQLYDWLNYIQYESNAKINYKQFKLPTYISPKEIEKHVDQLSVQ